MRQDWPCVADFWSWIKDNVRSPYSVLLLYMFKIFLNKMWGKLRHTLTLQPDKPF